MTDYRPRWKPTPMGRLIEWIKWQFRSPREAAFTIITVIFIVTLIMLLMGCQMPLRSTLAGTEYQPGDRVPERLLVDPALVARENHQDVGR